MQRAIKNTKFCLRFHEGSRTGFVPDPLRETADVSVDPRCVSTAQTPTYNSNLQFLYSEYQNTICEDDNGLGFYENLHLDQLSRVSAKRAE